MKRLFVQCMAFLALSGCADTAVLLSKGNILSSESMVSPNTIATGADGAFKDEDAIKLLNESFKLYQVEQKPNGNEYETDVLEAKLKKISIAGDRNQFLQIEGKNYFAATSSPNLAYSVLAIDAKAKYEHVMELQLFQKDPQFRLKYTADPYELLKYQQTASPNVRRVFLFQGYVAAPQVVLKHTLVESKSSANFNVIFQGASATLKHEAESYGRRFVFRRYANVDILDRLLTGKDPMFIEAASDSPTTNGKSDVDPQLLVIEYKGKKFRFSDDYAKHLKSESVVFNCPQTPPAEMLINKDIDATSEEFLTNVKINKTPITIKRSL